MSNKKTRSTKQLTLRSPCSVTDHAIDRFIERWGVMPSTSREHVETLLHERVIARALRFENIEREKQSIWRYVGPLPWEPHDVEILMVVRADGFVTTFLPPGSRKPSSRRGRR